MIFYLKGAEPWANISIGGYYEDDEEEEIEERNEGKEEE